ncbi:MAG TPA: D-cysteine desulfhydrase family protein, partial [Spongiibacteraceae bacterium]|nr:D-cysteine desulfhydrase family protein [Spongiibacteraceae bacterium]
KRDDLTGSVLSGNKVRKLEFSLAQALAEDCDTIITCGGLQSNHCRATALLCAQLGLHCQLILRGSAQAPYDGNLLLDYLAGADIAVYPEATYNPNLSQLLADAAQQQRTRGRRPFIIPTGASDGIGLWGYIAACSELRADFARHGIAPRHIVCATGSGGTQGGLNAGVALEAIDATVWGVAVCDGEAYFQQKVRSDLREWQQRYGVPLDIEQLPIRVIDGYVGPGYAQANTEVFATIKRLASSEGLVLDPVYTGKAFHALLCELQRGRFGDSGDIVFIHTGGMFGLFPQRDKFSC